jgi:HlyD family secretion protein
MTAATRIVIANRHDVIRVPSQALRYRPSGMTAGATPSADSEARVWLLRNGRPVALTVETGLDDDSFVEIVAGNVKPGDQVIVAEQRQASGSTVLPPRL